MIVVELLAAFYGIITLYACLHIGGQWLACKLEEWQRKRIGA